MASNENPLPRYVFGSGPATIGITDGPNDWDIWLCFRGTKDEVTFFLDRETSYPQFHPNNRRGFLPVRIQSIAKPATAERDHFQRNLLELTGYTFSYANRYSFKMTYDTDTRKGNVVFV